MTKRKSALSDATHVDPGTMIPVQSFPWRRGETLWVVNIAGFGVRLVLDPPKTKTRCIHRRPLRLAFPGESPYTDLCALCPFETSALMKGTQ